MSYLSDTYDEDPRPMPEPPLVVWCPETGDYEGLETCPDCECREECQGKRR
jgi:hypothetical protein